jgi:hypothetical protein
MDASTGVLHGDAASANSAPAAYAASWGGRPAERTSTVANKDGSGTRTTCGTQQHAHQVKGSVC